MDNFPKICRRLGGFINVTVQDIEHKDKIRKESGTVMLDFLTLLCNISSIAQVIIEILALSLVKDYIIIWLLSPFAR